MLGRPRKETPLVKVFHGLRVLTLDQLADRFDLSRATVFRRLREHGYYSSYNYSGRFLTIDEVAEFDPQGLWVYKSARFSKHGTLKRTVEHFVGSSERGMTHEELAMVLGVRTHDVLLELVRGDKLTRERLGPTFVYFERRRSIRMQQILRRRQFFERKQAASPTSQLIIATLLEVIKDPKVQREEIGVRCRRSGVSISRATVDAIFEMFDLDKKRAL